VPSGAKTSVANFPRRDGTDQDLRVLGRDADPRGQENLGDGKLIICWEHLDRDWLAG
jgi:hypothetical protein